MRNIVQLIDNQISPASGTKKTSLCNFAEARLLFWPVDQQMELSYSAINAPCA